MLITKKQTNKQKKIPASHGINSKRDCNPYQGLQNEPKHVCQSWKKVTLGTATKPSCL